MEEQDRRVTALRRARQARGLTLAQVVADIDALSPNGTGLTPSALSAYERGARMPSPFYRELFCEYYATTPEALFGDRFNGAERVHLITCYEDLIAAMLEVVRGAQDYLVITGSRSRERTYLDEIEKVLEQRPKLVHYRILFGPPRRALFTEHLLRLLEQRDPKDRSLGLKTLHLAIVEDLLAEPERFYVANEQLAVMVLPSLVTAGNLDTGIVLTNPHDAGRLIEHAKQVYAGARRVETVEAVKALEETT